MAQRETRLSTLAEIKVLSLESIRNFNGTDDGSPREETLDVETAVSAFAGPSVFSADEINIDQLLSAFKTVGIARSIKIDEDYGTNNVYAIGSPTRPRIVPGNMTVNVTCERIQLDKRNLYDFMSTPEYFYAPQVQQQTGILDAVYYTYMFVRNKEAEESDAIHDIYALMPRSSSKTLSNGDVMISHNVQLTGFKVNYGESGLGDFLNGIKLDITQELGG